MSVTPLSPEQLRRICDPAQFKFKTTAELTETDGIFGQPRGVRALDFGIGIRSHGYNIYVLGETGTGRTSVIFNYLRAKTREQETPFDWIYVHNFSIPHQPRAIEFPAGQGAQFKKQMENLVASLRDDLPKSFTTEAYNEEVDDLWNRMEIKQSLLMRELERKARDVGFRVIKAASGLSIAPMVGDEVMTAEHYAALTLDEQDEIDVNQQELEHDLEQMLAAARTAQQQARTQLEELDRRVAQQAISHHVTELRELYNDHAEVLLYLSEVHDDVLENVGEFRPDPNRPDKEPDLSRYGVNMFVDNGKTEGAPVYVEQIPTYNHLMGRIEYEMRDGVMSTHFSNIKPGSLHKANGGYLIMDALDLLRDISAWEALKQSIKGRKIVLQPSNTIDNSGRVLAKTIDPEAIPLDIKIILIGPEDLYYGLFEQEEDFNELFKVKADFGSRMNRDNGHEMAYAKFIAARCNEEKLPHFDPSAVARVVEYGSELSESQTKLTARFRVLADLVRESAFWTIQAGANVVTRQHVQHALDERIGRSNKLEVIIDEQIEEGLLMIAVDGERIGQVNGLSVLDIGDYSFGRPSRITARTYAGSGVMQIEREVDMSDPIHDKGVLIMMGYMGGQYAQEHPLSFGASLTFEQNYAGIGGDSASSAELYALLSALGNIPLKQGIAVTGSINQYGDIQPIGGATEKIEGFFRVCSHAGLTGEQGVVIPRSNVKDLMLHQDVIDAVKAGQFTIWAIENVTEGLEILTGHCVGKRDEDGEYPPDSIHGIVQAKLDLLAKRHDDSDDEEEEEE